MKGAVVAALTTAVVLGMITIISADEIFKTALTRDHRIFKLPVDIFRTYDERTSTASLAAQLEPSRYHRFPGEPSAFLAIGSYCRLTDYNEGPYALLPAGTRILVTRQAGYGSGNPNKAVLFTIPEGPGIGCLGMISNKFIAR
jgi:hypothetical protein